MLDQKHIINEFIKYVIMDIQDIYGVNENEANELLNDYNFIEMIMAEPDFVMHYNTEDWADRIYKKLSLATV